VLKAADAAKAESSCRLRRARSVQRIWIVHIGESGAAEPDYDAYSYGSRWNRYEDDEDDEDGEEGRTKKSTMKAKASPSSRSMTLGGT